MTSNKKPHFEVHPSVVYQLGESLISDAVQALIELIKNSYDADATYAKVFIDTKGVVDVVGSKYESKGGRIIVEDDGFGMDISDIENGWLTISNRKKRELKQAKETTPGGRTPLGDKGLGRLGVQRLGETLEIFTKSRKNPAYHFGFSWMDFETAPKLENVDIHLAEVNYPSKHGTKIVVSGIKEPDIWLGTASLKRLEQEISRMISPYKQIRDFMVIVEVDGKTLELVEISDKIRNIAPIRYTLKFDGEIFRINGLAKLDFFRPSSQKDQEQFALIVEADNGKALLEFLLKQPKAQSIALSKSKSNRFFVEFSKAISLSEMDKAQHITKGNDSFIANPGKFSGEIDSYDLNSQNYRDIDIFNKQSEFRNFIKSLNGIRVYRDGFEIRVGNDYLKLGDQWTSAKSYYGLKPTNTLGFIAISAKENIELEEMTDREGFKDSPYYRNFYALLEKFKDFTFDTHDLLGRSWSEFRKMRNEVLANVDSRKSVEELSHTIKTGLKDVKQYQEKLDSLNKQVAARISSSKTFIAKFTDAQEITPSLQRNISKELLELTSLLQEAEELIRQISNYLKEVGTLSGVGQVLDDRINSLRRQMDEMYEMMSLGLTAEALSHEINNVADVLTSRTKQVETTLRKKGVTDRPTLTFIEYVYSSVRSLRKQLSFLSPSLRYVRDQRHEFELLEFITDFSKYYSERLGKSSISIDVKYGGTDSFQIKMNKGKLTQVIDNLVINSEYWLKEDIAQKRLNKGIITIELYYPFIRFYDNGSGIDTNIESTIFEPFVSAKAKGQGRGLGLFIVKQLLDSEGCSIGLLPDRNHRRRLYKFQIDMRGAINE